MVVLLGFHVFKCTCTAWLQEQNLYRYTQARIMLLYTTLLQVVIVTCLATGVDPLQIYRGQDTVTIYYLYVQVVTLLLPAWLQEQNLYRYIEARILLLYIICIQVVTLLLPAWLQEQILYSSLVQSLQNSQPIKP